MKVMLSELRRVVREELHHMIDEIVSKEVPDGTAWKLSGKKGWGAKNKNGVSNYYYGEDETENKKKADAFRNDSERKKSEFLKKEDSQRAKSDNELEAKAKANKEKQNNISASTPGSKVKPFKIEEK